MRRRALLAALLLCAPAQPLPAQPLPAQQDAPLFDAESGLRIARYRAPVPTTPAGATRISAEQAAALHRRRGALFIDVLPAEAGHRDPASGRWALAAVHRSIPGARWFPESGRGVLAPDVERWFLDGVKRLSKGVKSRPVIVFCLADCWMSWNAARRLVADGYRDVRWFAEGTDGWRDIGLTLTPVTPENQAAVTAPPSSPG